MTLPVAVATCNLTFGSALTFTGNVVGMDVTVQSTHDLTWAATGQPLISFAETVSAAPGFPGSIILPVVDQTGFVDPSGAPFTMWAYVITIVYNGGYGVGSRTATKSFQPLTGQTTVDLDLLPGGSISVPVAGPIATVTSFNGATGAVVFDGSATAAVSQQVRRSTITDYASYGNGAWFIKRVTSAEYRMIRDLGDGTFLQQSLFAPTGLTGGHLVNQMWLTGLAVPMLSVEEDLSTFAGTWVGGGSSATVGYKAKNFTGVNFTSGSAVLTVTGGDTFAATDVGRKMDVPGAGTSGATLQPTISVYTSPTQVSVSQTAITTVTSGTATAWPWYKYSITAGSTSTWVSPSTATALGLVIVVITNGGLGKVTIDGSATAANLLPTAQDVVTSGAYPSSILVANGGTLNPTDRVVDCYGAPTDFTARVGIASGLAAAAHTVVVTATSYTHASGLGNRMYVNGFCYSTGAETPITANVDMIQTMRLSAGGSAYEYAYDILPTGGTTHTFVGNLHGSETQDSLTLNVDAVDTTMTDGQVLAVKGFAEFRRNTRLQHPDTGSTDIASIVTTYRLDSRGITIRHIDRWLVAGTMYVGYPCMFPVSGMVFDKATFDTNSTVYSAFTGSGVRFPLATSPLWAGSKATAVTLWDADGQTVCAVIMPAAKSILSNWNASIAVQVEDRAVTGSEKYNKVYFAKAQDAPVAHLAIAVGDVWQSEATYMWARMPAGADSVMSSLT